MTAPRVRPRFHTWLAESPGNVMQRLRDRLPRSQRCTGASVGHHAELFVSEPVRRVWSPWLSVTVEEDPNGGSTIHGRFGPHPGVWTLYMFLAFALGFALLVAATWGYAQWTMEITPWAWYAVPVIFALSVALYGVSLVGQRLGAEQMTTLRDILDELIAPDVPDRVRDSFQ